MNAKSISILKAILLPIAFTILLVGASFFKQLLPAQYERLDIDGTPNKTGKTRIIQKVELNYL